ncbi:MAG: DNA phosphorothioation system sulfurtransferase DndC [Ignavibacteriales bacterium]
MAARASLSKEDISTIINRIQRLFLEDEIPWVVGYSGGKDSTATLQLVWYALAALPEEQRGRKDVYVISTDTGVEQPVVAAWVKQSLDKMRSSAQEKRMPIIPRRLTPLVTNSYWVNLIGRGYPAPRPTFRWCTSRLKIEPSNRFIKETIKSYGETVLVLGTRKSESTRRAANMEIHEKHRIREYLSPNASLPNSWVFSPIEDWSNDDVWFYLLQYDNPWGNSNKDLLSMYRGASADNECPLVVDTGTPSCGSSRFGCWVCTVVMADRSMQAMIQNDVEKLWMTPLLEFRNEIGLLDSEGRIDDRGRRDFRRMNGTIKLLKDGRAVPGPYTKKWREHLLRRLLETEREVRRAAPTELQGMRLIHVEELQQIRRIWVTEKHEFDDAVPRIYEEVTGRRLPPGEDLGSGPFGEDEWNTLENLCSGNETLVEMVTSVLDIVQRRRGDHSRRSLTIDLEHVIRRCFFENEDDAVSFELQRQSQLKAGRQSAIEGLEYDDGGIDTE